MKEMDRREFLKGLGLVAGGAALTACSPVEFKFGEQEVQAAESVPAYEMPVVWSTDVPREIKPPVVSNETGLANISVENLAWSDDGLIRLDWGSAEIEIWSDDLVDRFELERLSLGESAEGREIFALSTGSVEGGGKKVLLLLAGMHANERTARVVANQIFEEFLRLRQEGRIRLPEDVVVVHMPLANPDGLENDLLDPGSGRKDGGLVDFPYERPALGPTECVVEGTYNGRDPNRGFPPLEPEAPPDYMAYSAANNPCHSMYPGGEPGEVTLAIMGLLDKLVAGGNKVVTFDYHAWSQQIVKQRDLNSVSSLMADVYANKAGYQVFPVSKYDSQGATFVDYCQALGIPSIAVETGGGGDGFVAGGSVKDNKDVSYFSRDPALVRQEVGKHFLATMAVMDKVLSGFD